MKIRYPATRRHSLTAICPHCGRTYYTMGMGTHIREAHKMIYETIARTKAKPVAKPVATPTAIKPVATPAAKSPLLTPIVRPVAPDDKITQELSEVTGKDLTECKRPDGTHFYTDQDICILLGRIIIETHQPRSEVALFNQFNIMDLIQEFEHRFKCRFDDVRKANQQIRTGKTSAEHYAFAQKYAHLEYSGDYGFKY